MNDAGGGPGGSEAGPAACWSLYVLRTRLGAFYTGIATDVERPLALPGDDVRPEDFVCFCPDGGQGLYIHPDIWHEGVFSTGCARRFFDRQGAVHARVSVDLSHEFGCLLEADPGARP